MRATLIVMRKELKEMFRDKRIRNNATIMPAMIMVVMLSAFGFIFGMVGKENQVVHVVKTDNQIVRQLKNERVKVVEIATLEEGQKLVREGKARLVLQFDSDFDSKVAADQATEIGAYYDPQQDTGKMALTVVQEELAKVNASMAAKVLKAHGIEDPKQLAPAQVKEKPIQVGTSETSEILVGMLPYLIVVYAFVGGLGAGSDIVAGEKEKQTLETLLIAPVRRGQIAFGKFLSLAVLCFMSSFSALMGVVLAGSSHLPIYAKLFKNGLGLDFGQIGTIVLILIPTVAFFASMLLAVSAYAKNTREAQSYLGLISVVVFMPAIFGQVIGLTDLGSKWWIRLIPVLNTSVTVRESLQGKSDVLGILLTIGVGAVLALIGIRIAVYLFKREQVLTRV